MNKRLKTNINKIENNSKIVELIDISNESDSQMDCLSVKSDSVVDETERQYLNSTVDKRFSGEDLCERANIQRTNGSVIGIDDYNEDDIQLMFTKETERDREIESMAQLLLDSRLDDSEDSNGSNQESDDNMEDINASDLKNWTPNVILPPNEDIEDYYSLDPLAFRIDACLRYRSTPHMKIPIPFESLTVAFGFNNSFLTRLKSLECKPSNLQLHVWPCLLKGHSFTCISGPKTGKTNSYLIPLMSWFDGNQTDDNEVKVGAIVICSSTRKALRIEREARKWKSLNGDSKVRIVVMYSSNEKRQFTSILNGCDILITTPSPLLRSFESNIIDSKNTRCLILDDADVSIALHYQTIRDIYLAFASSKKESTIDNNEEEEISRGHNPMAFQTIVFSEKWTRDVRWFYKEVQHIPIALFASYYEASIAFQIKCNIQFITHERDRDETLSKLLIRLKDKHRIAIVCRDVNEIKYLKRCFKPRTSIVVTEHTDHVQLDTLSKTWRTESRILLITDEAIKLHNSFKNCKCIIHYKLPFDFKNCFGDRFRLMNNYFKTSKTPLDHEFTKDLVNYILLSPTDKDYIPDIVSYLRRLNEDVPDSIAKFYERHRQELCPYFSAFRKCPIVATYCFKRHEFIETDKPNPELPESGQIKIVISYVLGANQFYIRVNEFRGQNQSSGNWQKMSLTFDEIKPQLNQLRNTDFNTLKDYTEGEVYGITVRAEVLRVRLSRILGDEEIHFYQKYDPKDSSKIVELFCIDYGHKFTSRSRELFELPLHLKSLPSFAHKAFLFGIKPVDNEIDWDFKSTQRFYELVDNYRVSEITAWIMKQIDGVFWLNRLNIKKNLKNAKIRLNFSPIDSLIEEKLALQNKVKLSKCNNDYNKTVNIWHNHRLKNISYNSQLSDESTYVVVTHFVSLDQIYVMYENRVKRLETIESKWQSISDLLEPLSELTEGQLCFCKYDDNSINRARIVSIDDEKTVTVFFVDHGETNHSIAKSSIYRIKENHLKELPFQAIKVKLFGVKQLKPIDFDVICDLTRNQNEEYLMCLAQKEKFENGINSVRLFVAKDENECEFVALSKLLVDMNYAQFVDGEENNGLSFKIDKVINDPNDDQLDDEYLLSLENEMTDKFCQQFILQSLGLNEMSDLEPKPEVKSEKKESQMSKVMKRLKMIKENAKSLSEPKQESDSDEESPKFNVIPPELIDYRPGDFDYEVGEGVAYYDSNDNMDNESLVSDEDAMFDDNDELMF